MSAMARGYCIAPMMISIARWFALLMRPPVLAHLALAMVLVGCMVGPDFNVPIPPPVQNLTPRPLPDRVAADGKVQRFVRGEDIPGQWWRLFHSRALTNLVEGATRDNFDLKAAQAALRVAYANYKAQEGALYPLVGANETSSRQKVATADLSPPTVSQDPYFTLHTGQLTISYVPDVFGGIRRQVEAAAAQEESQNFMFEAVYLTLTSNVALAAIQVASLDAQIKETIDAVEAESLLARGEAFPNEFTSASARDWAALDAALGQAKQTIPLLQKQLAAQRDLLAALSGHFAGEPLPPHFALAELTLPKDLPRMLPSQIVEQRPDVRAARANLHAATALVGVAIANRLPLFNLTGNVGRASGQFSNLFNPDPQFLFWTMAGSVTQSIFDGFTLEQRQRAAEAGVDQVASQYGSTVVNAFQNVADALQAIELDAKSLRSAIAAEKAARENLCLTAAAFVGYDGKKEPENAELTQIKPDAQHMSVIKKAFVRWWRSVCMSDGKLRKKLSPAKDPDKEDSAPSGIDLVTSEQLFLTTRLSLVTARAARYTDVVALFQTLGGGWWNRDDLEEARNPAPFAGTRPWLQPASQPP